MEKEREADMKDGLAYSQKYNAILTPWIYCCLHSPFIFSLCYYSKSKGRVSAAYDSVDTDKNTHVCIYIHT